MHCIKLVRDGALIVVDSPSDSGRRQIQSHLDPSGGSDAPAGGRRRVGDACVDGRHRQGNGGAEPEESEEVEEADLCREREGVGRAEGEAVPDGDEGYEDEG